MTHKIGDTIRVPYVMSDPARRGEFTHEMRDARILGFSHPSCVARGWGWQGSVHVQFLCDGHKQWAGLSDPSLQQG